MLEAPVFSVADEPVGLDCSADPFRAGAAAAAAGPEAAHRNFSVLYRVQVKVNTGKE